MIWENVATLFHLVHLVLGAYQGLPNGVPWQVVDVGSLFPEDLLKFLKEAFTIRNGNGVTPVFSL